jgi:Flp pilus assembly protein TadD
MPGKEESIRSEIRRCKRATPVILRQIEAALEESSSAELWILRGDAIQLSDGDTYTLADVEQSYMRAVELEPSRPESYESLGYFHLSVMDDAAEAKTFFERAIALGGGQSARHGLQLAVSELHDRAFEQSAEKINQK